MKPFFADNARQELLRQVATSWKGTPFVPHASVKGAGVDCVHLAAQIYVESGHLDTYQFASYTMDGGHHNALSQVTAWLDASPRFIKGVYPVLAGDLICFRIGKVIHHVGIAVSERNFVHVTRGGVVSLARIDDTTWLKRLAGVYRPVEL